MGSRISRRTVLGAPLGAAAIWGLTAPGRGQASEASLWSSFPAQNPQRVYDTVLYAHTDIDKVGALVEASPALANAAMDWGFGDWETAIGAASHMGRRDMVELLLGHGARPDIFTYAMMGNLAAVKALIEALPGVQTVAGPHGITLLAHARAGKEQAEPVVAYLESLGDANPQQESAPLALPAAAYVGEYAWSDAVGDRVEVQERRGQLALRRGEGFGRTLFHLGEHAFYPTGAHSVRVRFQVAEDRATGLEILDPEVIVAARRIER